MNVFLHCSFRLVPCRLLVISRIRKVASDAITLSNRYEEAISTLNSLQSNKSILKSTDYPARSIQDIRHYLSFFNIQLDHIDRLNIIHVAGTKGKGSTCAFTESILRQYGYRTGFFSSPHLIEVRERIRINGELLPKEKFVEYFWKCYNTIDNGVQQSTNEDPVQMPFYFSFLTTMMFYVFMHEQVDVAIVEVGIGGEYDCTNIIKSPVVCGVTSLGLDHVNILGSTIEQIAWQKAGIFKQGVSAVTVPQVSEAMSVLMKRAEEKQCLLTIAPSLNSYQNYPFHLSLAGDVQEVNASLAIQLVFHWLHARQEQSYNKLMTTPLSQQILHGLATCRWPGRNEIVDTTNATYYLDGAHTVESIEQCKNWFSNLMLQQQHQSTKNILLFYCTHDRQPDVLLQPLMLCKFDCIVFCTPTTTSETISHKFQAKTKSSNDSWRAATSITSEIGRLSLHVAAFEKLLLSTVENQTIIPSIHCFHTVSQALAWINDSKSSKPTVLVTGSLYLVGAVLKLLSKNNGNN